MESIGEKLKAARTEKSVTLEDVARATRIKLDILEKMEGDEFSTLASPMYVKGFLKLYSEYLGLDSQPIVDSFLSIQGGVSHHKLQLETEVTSPPHKTERFQLSTRKVLVGAGILAITVSVVWCTLFFWPGMDKVEKAPTHAVVTTESESIQKKIPTAEFNAYYNPDIKLPPELSELPER